MEKCEHNDKNIYYFNATNEDGWLCTACKTELGFRPDLDRRLIYTKVMGILMDLHTHKFIYVSNASHGDGIKATVVNMCKEKDAYDQYSIISFILECVGAKSHAEYWRQKSTIRLLHDKNEISI